MLYANLLTLRAPRLKTSTRERARKSCLLCLKRFDPICWVPACTQGLLMSVWNSMKIHSWYRKGGSETVVYQHEAWGRKWMVLIRHWNLFVWDRWCIRNGGGRWHLGGRPGFFILRKSKTADSGREEDNKRQTKEKPVGRVKMETNEESQENLVTFAHDEQWFISVNEFLNTNSHLQWRLQFLKTVLLKQNGNSPVVILPQNSLNNFLYEE